MHFFKNRACVPSIWEVKIMRPMWLIAVGFYMLNKWLPFLVVVKYLESVILDPNCRFSCKRKEGKRWLWNLSPSGNLGASQEQEEILEVQAQGNERNSCLLLNKRQWSIKIKNNGFWWESTNICLFLVSNIFYWAAWKDTYFLLLRQGFVFWPAVYLKETSGLCTHTLNFIICCYSPWCFFYYYYYFTVINKDSVDILLGTLS